MEQQHGAADYFALAQQHAASGAFQQAFTEFQRVLELEPASAEAAQNAGAALLALGRPGEAETYLEHALQLRPAYPDALLNLGNAMALLGRFDAARTHYERAMLLDPRDPQPASSLGLLAVQQGDFGSAVRAFQAAAARAPYDPQIHYNLGFALHRAGSSSDALAALLRAVELAPNHVKALETAGSLLRDAKRWDEALQLFARAAALDPGSARIRLGFGLTLSDLGRTAQALTAFEEAVQCDPAFSEAHYNLGVMQLYLGDFERAGEAFGRALELDPKNAKYYDGWFNVRRADARDEQRLARMQQTIDEETSLAIEDRIQLHYTMAKALEDLERYGEAFDHLACGSALKRSTVSYDEAGELDLMERIAGCFTAERMLEFAGVGDPSAAPVFVIGMPRSGTTLVEQIIASHPDVQALGERTDLGEELLSWRAPYPEMICSAAASDLRAIGAGYLRRIGPIEKARVTDKMPANFMCAGIIALTLPNAKIVHVRRDPVDTCLSCFAQLFTFGNPHTYDLGELGRYYCAYERLMEHWRSVLPSGVMLEVSYEDVVADLETQARAIVKHTGLSWDERCLSFHRTKRAVRTASMTQVRQPIYTGSVGRHARYGDRLKALLVALGQ